MTTYLHSLMRKVRARAPSFGTRGELAQWESEGGRLKEAKARTALDWITIYTKRVRGWLTE